MRIRTKEFLKEKFKGYYTENEASLPPKYEEREWGIISLDKNYPEKTVMKRHKSFSTKNEARNYFRSMVPAHIYFSSAYYERPNAKKMEDKGWKFADLVFDLDADHLEETKDLSYPQMLEKVKNEAKHLIKDFLINDFGFSEEKMKIVFSGGRGYHIHVRDEKVRDLNNQERREIIDYLFGNGLESIIKEEKRHRKPIAHLSNDKKTWNQRIRRYLIEKYFPQLLKKNRKEAKKELTIFDGIGEKKAERILSFLEEKENLDKIKKEGKLEIAKGVSDKFWNQLIKKAINDIKAEADEPVTSDIKRLIRLPTSLHGGTGFKVKPLELNEIDEFNPFRDAIAFGNDLVKVFGKKEYTTNLLGNEIKLKKGEIKKIPTYAAVFLSCIGVSEVEGW